MKRKTWFTLIIALLLVVLSTSLVLAFFKGNHLVKMMPVSGGSLETGEIGSKTTVSIPDLYVGEYEITFLQVAKVYNWALDNKRIIIRNNRIYIDPKYMPFFSFNLMDLKPAESGIAYSGSSFKVKPGKEQYPASYIGWFGAAFFCNFLSEMEGLKPCYDTIEWSLIPGADGYRLPTFEEWEYLAQGGSLSKGFAYPGSNNPDEVSWSKENSGGLTHQVGLKRPNELGLYDMGGNLSEFCTEIIGSLKGTSGSNDLVTGFRIWRGGAFDLPPCDISYYVQNCNQPDYFLPCPDVGFRVVRDK